MIGDATPLQIPGFDPSILPAIPGLPGLTPPGNPPSGGGASPPPTTAAAVELAIDNSDAITQGIIYLHAKDSPGGHSFWTRDMLRAAVVGLAAGAAAVYFLVKR